MKSEFIIVKTNTQEYKVFFQDGFYSLTNPIKRLHKHNYAEVHVIANGNAVFYVGDSLYTLTSGSMMIIPRGVFHYCYSKDENTFHTAFQIYCEAEKTTMYSVGADVILNLCAEIEKCKKELGCSHIHKEWTITLSKKDYLLRVMERNYQKELVQIKQEINNEYVSNVIDNLDKWLLEKPHWSNNGTGMFFFGEMLAQQGNYSYVNKKELIHTLLLSDSNNEIYKKYKELNKK